MPASVIMLEGFYRMAELKLRKADIVLAVVFVLCAVAIFVWAAMYFTDSGNTVTVTAYGNELGEYPLSGNVVVIVKDGEIAGEYEDLPSDGFDKAVDKCVSGTLGNDAWDGDVNVAVIKDGKVYMDRAGCDNQHCVQHQKISRGNEQIVCLPNKVILQITDDGESEVDTVAE